MIPSAPPFLSEDWLLLTPAAQALYHDYAAGMPILDYHNHLPPGQVAVNHRFANLSEIWLHGDHYKWRAMRTAGVEEHFCTGTASDREKFDRWAAVVPQTMGNPLYHWTHMELKFPFGLADVRLNPQTADRVWQDTSEKLAEDAFRVQGLLQQYKVALLCTTDDPCDSLEHHRALAADPEATVQMLPAWRPDKALQIDRGDAFVTWVNRLGEAANLSISTFTEFLEALHKRHEVFHAHGCRLSDHGLDEVVFVPFTSGEIDAIFSKALMGGEVSRGEMHQFASAMLLEFGRMDHARGWVQQYHIGALRNTNRRMFQICGPDAGFDSIGDRCYAPPLAMFLDQLDATNQLAPTILYNLNPRDNAMIATMIGNFQDGSRRGKMQFGSGWWFLDQKDGMEAQLKTLGNLGLLSTFVGMLTDSRSFLSFSRHDYFRRILCNVLGRAVHQGDLPDDLQHIGHMVQDICYRNAVDYFNFPSSNDTMDNP
jgi:glucuronate isomerase